ncbi:hypothetical protein [Staphylococcus petrasii]|uniref:EF-hand domain-containing protein n=1 Tax=Staphylococcus petrasii TaxID=1276936 RepID=A0ABY2KUP2_9STAP|nr:hypothetical protein [Staphylococcus petrasii]TGE15868.1 hypothetical protein BJR09_10440 [Staphylococcus petrasii]
MKTVINILIIAILSVILVGLVFFDVTFVKDTLSQNHTVAKSENKNHQQEKSKPKTKDVNSNEISQSNSNNQDTVEESQTQQTNTNNQNQQTAATSTNETKTKENESSENDPNNIMRFDTNGDGIISTSEVTPEAQKLVDAGKLQPTSDAMAAEWSKSIKEKEATYNQPKMTQEQLDNLTKDEQEGIGYNPNNPRGDVGGPGMSPEHDGIGKDDVDLN